MAVWHREDAPLLEPQGRLRRPAGGAASLIRAGLIEIWAEPAGAGEGGLLLPGPALGAVSDHGNWWRHDPDDNADPAADLAQAGPDTGPMTTLYPVMTSQEALDRGLVRFPFWGSP